MVLPFVAGAALPLSGCFQNGSLNNISAISSGAIATTQTVFPINVSQVVLSNVDPTTTIELVSTDNSIGQYCSTAANCECQFSFINSNGSFQQVVQTLEYSEVNLARCLYTQVNSNAGYYDVALVVTASGVTSNTTRVFVSALNPSLDPSVANNYVFENRFMCRDVISKARAATNFYGQNLEDPNAWVLSQAYNFYSASLGLDYGAAASATAGANPPTGFECPPVPNDQSFDPSINYNVYSLASVNFSTYGGSNITDNTIWPNTDKVGVDPACPTGAEAKCEKYLINRHDYYLAAFQDGTFKQPICTPHTPSNMVNTSLQCNTSTVPAPVTLTAAQATSTAADVIGFSAMPDSNEACPSTSVVTIPAGKKWAKLWRFRASLQQRTLQMATNPGQIGSLVCTTRNQECVAATATGANTKTNCWDDGTTTYPDFTGSGPRLGSQQMIGSPGFSFGNCSSIGTIGDDWTPTGAGGSYANAGAACNTSGFLTNNGAQNCCGDNGTLTFSGAANYTPQGDYCDPTLRGQINAAALGGLAQDVWLISNQQRGCIEADTDANGKLFINGMVGANPYTYSSLSVDASSLYDYLYVVSPVTVHISDMTNPSSTVSEQFTPFRKDRNGNNINYGLSLGSENTATAFERLVQFPICVLQDTK